MAENARRTVAVIMQRRTLEKNRWQDEVWEPSGVLSNYAGDPEPRVLVEHPGLKQWLYPGFEIVVRISEAEGYYHNVSSGEPSVFVLWRMEGANPADLVAVPKFVTVSYDEA